MSKFRKHVFLVIVLFFTISIYSETKKLDSTKIKNYQIISEIWGTLKFLHPTAEQNKKNWNLAYKESIKDLDKIENANIYKRIEKMLQTLKDPHTYVYKQSEEVATDTTAINSLQVKDEIIYLKLNNYNKINSSATDSLLQRAVNLSKKNKGIVVDLRKLNGNEKSYRNLFSKNNFIESLISDTLKSSSYKYIEYHGYPSEYKRNYYKKKYITDSYYSVLKGKRKENEIPVVFIFNNKNYISKKIKTLSFNKKAYLINIGKKPELNSLWEFDNFKINAQLIKPKFKDEVYQTYIDKFLDKNTPIEKTYDIATKNIYNLPNKELPKAIGFSASNRDSFESYEFFPNKESRIMALAKMYIVLDIFSPHKKLMTYSPVDNFKRSLPEIIAASDSLEYNIEISKFLHYLNDSHAWNCGQVFYKNFLKAEVPIKLYKINNKFLISKIIIQKYAEENDLKLGDEIIKVNDKNVLDFFNVKKLLFSSSNPNRADKFITNQLLKGKVGSEINITIKRNGNKQNKNLKLITYKQIMKQKKSTIQDTIKVLEDNIGYVNLDILQKKDIKKIFTELKDTKGIIFDMRGYPNGVMWDFAEYFIEDRKVLSVNVIPKVSYDYFFKNQEKTIISKTICNSNEHNFNKPTVVLMNEETQSQAEATCYMLKKFANAAYIGRQTSGADGNISYIYLPGQIFVIFTGMDPCGINNKSQQGVGLLPDIKVERTIDGIKKGRDEVLEKAINFLNK